MVFPERIETTRLILRRPIRADSEHMFRAFGQDPEVSHFLAWRAQKTIEDAEADMHRRIEEWKTGERYNLMIELQSDHSLLGIIASTPKAHSLKVGYVISRPHWRQSYATEAIKTILDFGFQQTHIFRIWAVCDAKNISSARLLEKLGMQREGLLRRWELHPNISDEPPGGPGTS